VNRQASILAQFFLVPARMPVGGVTFNSTPSVVFTGTARARAGSTLTPWDSPSASFGVELFQRVLVGGRVIAQTQHDEWIAQVINDMNETRARVMPASLACENVRFALDRRVLLEIQVEVRFKFRLEGNSTVSLSSRRDDLPFTVVVPQWAIFSD
jgi:hypothetical protein